MQSIFLRHLKLNAVKVFKIEKKFHCNKRFKTNKLKLKIVQFTNKFSLQIKQINKLKNLMKLIRVRQYSKAKEQNMNKGYC